MNSPDLAIGPQGLDLIRQQPLEMGACVLANPDHPSYTADKVVTRLFPGGKSAMIAVMDGVGAGSEASASASEMVQKKLLEQESLITAGLTIAHARQLLIDAIFKSSLEIGTLQSKLGDSNVDTTVSAGILCSSISGEDKFLVTANVGDSRIYRYKPHDGTVTQLTKDNSLTQLKVDNGLITQQEAFLDPQRNIIMKSVGDRKHIKTPKDIGTLVFEVEKGDIFLAVSDGVTDNLSPSGFTVAVREELHRSFDKIKNKPDLRAYAKGIATRATRIMTQGTAPQAKKDDVSVAILRI